MIKKKVLKNYIAVAKQRKAMTGGKTEFVTLQLSFKGSSKQIGFYP